MSAEPVSRSLTTADGLTLHVSEYGLAGDRRLPAICLPGLTRTGQDFDALARYLAPRRVLTLDYRGRGRSDYDPDPAHYSLPVETADVVRLIKTFDAEPAIFIGTSRGGLITLLLAGIRPAAIAGVVFNDIGPVIEPAGLARIAGYVGKMGEPRDFDEAAAILRRLFADQFPKLTTEDWLSAARRGFREQDGRLVATYDPQLARAFDNFDPTTPLPTLWTQFDALAGKPAMVIRGANSDLLSEDTVAEMERRHQALAIVTVPDQGHPPLLNDGVTMAAISEFAARCDAGCV